MDLAAAFVALDLDPRDPGDAVDVAIVRAVARRRLRGAASSGPAASREVITGPRIARARDDPAPRPIDRWQLP